MAILDTNKYYYFRLRNGQPYAIKESLVPINTNIMHNYQELTAGQIAFYLEHPAASIAEIVKCELNPPHIPPIPDLQEYIAKKVKELKDACHASLSVTSLEYAMANAVLAGTALTYTGDKYYTTIQAKAVMKQFMDESKHAITIYDTYKPQIEGALSTESVDTIYNAAIVML